MSTGATRLRHLRRTTTLCAVTLLGAAACGACGESSATSPAAPESDAGADTAIDSPSESAVDAPADSSLSDADGDAIVEAAPWDGRPNGCEPFEPPPSVPVGWERWNGWSCDCPLFIPGKSGEMPPPIEWEPCQESIAAGVSCQRMKHFWNESGDAISYFPKMSLDPATGKPLIAFSRYEYNGDPNTRYVLVAEADGPVRTAFLQVNPRYKGCEFTNSDSAAGRYVLRGLGDTWDGPLTDHTTILAEGAIAGEVGETYPKAVWKQPADLALHSDFFVSRDWIIRWWATHTAISFDLQTTLTIYDGAQDPDHLPGGRTMSVGEEVIVEVGDGRPAGVMTWNVHDGLRPLIRWYGDANHAAGNFGTDGKDMVWTYVEGSNLGGGKYETMSVMTAPYTTDGALAMASARRLRNDVKGFDDDGWAVGCGYAARAPGLAAPLNNALYIVRLSDGVSWTLPGRTDIPRLDWGAAIALTCDELFASVSTQTETYVIPRILRIRLDSLGPGTPPD